MPDTLQDKQERETAAMARKHERESELNTIKYLGRKPKEVGQLTRVAKALSPALVQYDSQVDAPALAESLREVYAQIIARLNVIANPAPVPSAPAE